MTDFDSADAARTAVVPLALSAILTEPLPALGAFRGRITDKRPFSKHTQLAQLTLAAADPVEVSGSVVRVELKGPWADKAVRTVMKGDVLVLLTTGMVRLGGANTHKKQEDGPPRVRFGEGVTGWIKKKDGSEELWQFSERSSKRSRAPTQPNKPTLPSVPSISTTQNVTIRAPIAPTMAPACEGADTLLSDRNAASRTVPKFVHSAPHEGSRSRKRQRRDTPLGWGLETAAGLRYLSLAEAQELVQSTDRAALQVKRVSIIAIVNSVSDLCPPKEDARVQNWYRQFTIVDPTRVDAPVELQWYWPRQEGLPDLSPGQILLARNLLIRPLANGSPMLLSGSFSKTAHAVLAPASLRLKPPHTISAASPGVDAKARSVNIDAWVIEPDPEELGYARRLVDWTRRNSSTVDSARARTASLAAARADGTGEREATMSAKFLPAAVSRPLLHIRDLEEGKFCDLVGMVTKIHAPAKLGVVALNQAVSLYLTDYTPHPSLHEYPDPSAVGLPGRLILQISLFGSTSAPLAALLDARTGEVKRGRLVWVRNVRVKLNRVGELEGTVVEETNPKFRTKASVEVVDLRKKDHEEKWGARGREIQNRHREFWAARSLLGART